MAMLGFAGTALAELQTQVPAGEQLAGDVFGVLLLSLTFTLASLFPKFSSGSSLKVRWGGGGACRLSHSTATHAELQQILAADLSGSLCLILNSVLSGSCCQDSTQCCAALVHPRLWEVLSTTAAHRMGP